MTKTEQQFTEEDRKVMEFGIAHNLGIRYKEASQHLLHDYDQLRREADGFVRQGKGSDPYAK